jgi:hypothetical protein
MISSISALQTPREEDGLRVLDDGLHYSADYLLGSDSDHGESAVLRIAIALALCLGSSLSSAQVVNKCIAKGKTTSFQSAPGMGG